MKGTATQAKFGKDGTVLTTVVGMYAEQSSVDVLQLVHCPFCLGEDTMQTFLISTKKGLSLSKGECRMCGHGMMLRNLLSMKSTPEKYAEWVWSYARSGFWQKIQFNEWKNRLEEMGWSRPFWDKYKALKTEAVSSGQEPENYVDYMNRQGEEAAAEWNQEQPGE